MRRASRRRLGGPADTVVADGRERAHVSNTPFREDKHEMHEGGIATPEGEPLARSQPIFLEYEGNRAVRQGRWKLVAKFPPSRDLCDIDADRTEQHDLAAQEPVRGQVLAARDEAWAQRAGVLKWPANAVGKAGKKKTGGE